MKLSSCCTMMRLNNSKNGQDRRVIKQIGIKMCAGCQEDENLDEIKLSMLKNIILFKLLKYCQKNRKLKLYSQRNITCINVQFTQMISIIQKCLDCSKLTAIFLSFIWLFLVTRYLEVKPEYVTKEHIKILQENTKPNGVVRMNTITNTIMNQDKNLNSQKQSPLTFFNLLELVQSKNRIACENHLEILVINANYNSIGDSYLALYKQIQKIHPLCKNLIFQLNRKTFLLMNSELLISYYALQVALTIDKFVNKDKMKNLVIITFEEGCTILFKAFEYLPPETIAKIDGMIMINTYSHNFQILYQPSRNYIQKIQNRLMQSNKKMEALNATRIISISTQKFWDSDKVDFLNQSLTQFLWEGKKLQNTVSINTRFMKGLYMLYHQQDYWTCNNFTSRIVKLLMNFRKYKKIQMIEYFLYYGEIYTKVEKQLKEIKSRLCFQGRLSNLNKITRVIATPCLQIEVATKMKQRENHTLLIVTSRKSYMFSDKFERIQPTFSSLENHFFIFDKAKNLLQVTIINPDRADIMVQFHRINGPQSNPLQPQQIFSYNPSVFYYRPFKNFTSQRRLIKICPSENILVFPDQFYNSFKGNQFVASYIFYTLNKMIIDYMESENRTISGISRDCYPDLMSQIRLIPPQLQVYWYRQRNVIVFLLICSYVKSDRIFSSFYAYFLIICLLRWFYFSSFSILINLLEITFCIFVEQMVDIMVHLIRYVQDMLEVKHKKFIIYFIMSITAIDQLKLNHVLEVVNLSPWKILCLSLIFLVNKKGMIPLLIKLYYLFDYILYNYHSPFEIVLITLWLFANMDTLQKKQQNKVGTLKDHTQKQKDGQSGKVSILDTLLAVSFSLLIDGPSEWHQLILTGYIVLKYFKVVIIEKYKKGEEQ